MTCAFAMIFRVNSVACLFFLENQSESSLIKLTEKMLNWAQASLYSIVFQFKLSNVWLLNTLAFQKSKLMNENKKRWRSEDKIDLSALFFTFVQRHDTVGSLTWFIPPVLSSRLHAAMLLCMSDVAISKLFSLTIQLKLLFLFSCKETGKVNSIMETYNVTHEHGCAQKHNRKLVWRVINGSCCQLLTNPALWLINSQLRGASLKCWLI